MTRSTVSQCRTMLVGSKRALLAAAFTASPSADSKVLIIAICSRSSFDRKFTAKKTSTAAALFCRKTIRVEIVIASPARTSIRCDARRPTTPSDGATIVVFNTDDAVGREERSSEWFAARPRGSISAAHVLYSRYCLPLNVTLFAKRSLAVGSILDALKVDRVSPLQLSERVPTDHPVSL